MENLSAVGLSSSGGRGFADPPQEPYLRSQPLASSIIDPSFLPPNEEILDTLLLFNSH